jgi:hypothetical protein
MKSGRELHLCQKKEKRKKKRKKKRAGGSGDLGSLGWPLWEHLEFDAGIRDGDSAVVDPLGSFFPGMVLKRIDGGTREISYLASRE